MVHYLGGDRDRLRLTVDLGPVAANIERLGQIYFADAIASLQQRSEPDFEVFKERLSKVAAQLVAGDVRIDGLPSLALSHDQAISGRVRRSP
ncbi:hypothetical protein FBY35_2832 [Streptomyces sp. SLBN-118]|uniref:hypothetical protein n=1 Tax=Streptomyces sp. SLBN-118 TaxID=2768454 RepID=UPI0011545E83|nr:hypothetical protein [Streptomyces sp. SLBN-118]TQK52398.1 hypothetical protein FBY35_2832 [Streptomyces sp. SLBN-118]